MGRGTKVQKSWDPPQAGRAHSKPPSPTRVTKGLALMEARMVFSGPDAIRDHRTRRAEHTHYIGETSPAIEGTSDANYLWRPASCSRAPPRRSDCPGEIGWGVRELSHFARKNLQSGAQIKRGLIWQAAEDQATHRYQSPWQPAPYILEQQGHGARARLAWDLGRYEGYLHPRSKWAAVIQAAQPPALPKSKGREKIMLIAIFFLRTIAGLELQLSSAILNISSVDLQDRLLGQLAMHRTATSLLFISLYRKRKPKNNFPSTAYVILFCHVP
uniref:Sperm microtubule inner protein 2 n=1 Tax=Anas platyrhynchos platyrhynchos TaxID=8840 RepID=U3J7C5_ANAPP